MTFLLLLLACRDTKAPPAAAEDWTPASDDDACARIAAGPPGDGTPILELSEAHADVRLFGEGASFAEADAALVAALQGGWEVPDVEAYAATFPACALPADPTPLGAASVEQVGDVAWVRPGTGEVTLPDGVTGVVLDLRDLPDAPELAEALAAALGPALATDLARVPRKLRGWDGYVDQFYSATNVYTVGMDEVQLEPWAATGPTDLPLAVVTGPRLPPLAAELAGTVAIAGRGLLVGESVLSGVAEVHTSPVGETSLAWRAMRLVPETGDWPDVIPAQVSTGDPEGALAGDWDAPVPATGEDTRPPMGSRDPYAEEVSADGTLAERQAALVISHGALRRFFPYFSVVGDGIDDRLLEVLEEELDASDRPAFVRALGRLGETLHDGHVFFGDLVETDASVVGYLPVRFDHLDGRPVIAHSGVDELAPGDTLVAIDGEPVEDVYAELLAWHGAGTEGYALDLCSRVVRRMYGTTTYTVEDPDGASRDVVVEPHPVEDLDAVPFTFRLRESGLLTDLGAADVGYVNLSYEVMTDAGDVDDVLAEPGLRALVVDMRGYPGVNHYAVASALIDGAYASPTFRVPTYQGPGEPTISESSYDLSGTSTFAGPIALLVGPTTVSAAENFSMMLVGADRVTVVGRRSAGTNGNITGLKLPGGFYLSFTGMEVLYPDGSTFHGVGIVPEVEAAPTAASYRDDTDPELLAAIEALSR